MFRPSGITTVKQSLAVVDRNCNCLIFATWLPRPVRSTTVRLRPIPTWLPFTSSYYCPLDPCFQIMFQQLSPRRNFSVSCACLAFQPVETSHTWHAQPCHRQQLTLGHIAVATNGRAWLTKTTRGQVETKCSLSCS